MTLYVILFGCDCSVHVNVVLAVYNFESNTIDIYVRLLTAYLLCIMLK